MYVLLIAAAFAEGGATHSAIAPRGVSIGASLVGEAVSDPSLSAVYGDTSLSGEVRAYASFAAGLEAGVSVGYRRLGGVEVEESGAASAASSWLWYAPLSLTFGGSWQVGEIATFAGVGPSLVIWAEQAKSDADLGFSGGKYGVLLDAGVRVPLRGFGPSLFDPEQGLRGVDVEADIGYRASFRRRSVCEEAPCGLGFSALRLGIGVRARF